MSESNAEPKAPPYISYATFRNFMEGLRAHPLPQTLDKTLMSNLSYGTQSALVATLKALDLIDDGGVPTDKLVLLHGAIEEERAAFLAEILRSTYPYIWDGTFDLSRTTQGALEDQFRKAADIKGSTVEKVIAFFTAAAAEAGIELSPHLKVRATGGGTRRMKSRTKRRADPKVDDAPPPPPSQPRQDLKSQLLAKFPDFNPEWSPELQAKWFDGFERFMKGMESE